MLNKNRNNNKQIEMICVDQIVPENHLLRKIDATIDFSFIYTLVEEFYCLDNGRPCIDPVMLLKIVLLQYLYGIKSMRQTIREIEVNVAYRWFLGLGFSDPVPHFSTFSQNYRRRFSDTDIFEKIFQQILGQAWDKGLVDASIQFVDATHVKAHANRHKNKKIIIAQKTRSYQRNLEKEINEDRDKHDKKPLTPPKNPSEPQTRTITQSKTDPESGLFRKGEHKEVFAYNVQTSCDKNGWVLAYDCIAGNENDCVSFDSFYENKLKPQNPEKLVMDAGYKTPAIAKRLMDDKIQAVIPYTRPKKSPPIPNGFYKTDYIYDEHYDCYLCPEGEVLSYTTTDRKGHKHYQSDAKVCKGCKSLDKCTKNRKFKREITRHIWQDALEAQEEYRYTSSGKREYSQRKETIERIFGTAKEYHGFRYTNMIGRAKMDMKAALTFACMNMKKLALILTRSSRYNENMAY